MTLQCNYVCGDCNVTLTSAKANSKHVKSGDPASTWWSSQLCGQFQFLGGKSHTEAKIKHSDCEQLDSDTHNRCSVLPSTYPTFPFLHWIPTLQAWWHYLAVGVQKKLFSWIEDWLPELQRMGLLQSDPDWKMWWTTSCPTAANPLKCHSFSAVAWPGKKKKTDQKIAFFLCHDTSRLTTENESSMNQQHWSHTYKPWICRLQLAYWEDTRLMLPPPLHHQSESWNCSLTSTEQQQ